MLDGSTRRDSGSYRYTEAELKLARAHGGFSTGWRELTGPGQVEERCPCGCPLRGGVHAHWCRTNPELLLKDGAAFALYFELLARMAWLSLTIALVMSPILIQRLALAWGKGSLGLTVVALMGSADIERSACASGKESNCSLIEAAGLLNTSVLLAVIVVLPEVRTALKDLLPVSSPVDFTNDDVTGESEEEAEMLQQSIECAVLLQGLPPSATEDVVSRFVAQELERANFESTVGKQRVVTSTNDLPQSTGVLKPVVLLGARDCRLAPLLDNYAVCRRTVLTEVANASSERGDRLLKYLQDADSALRSPPHEFGDRGWDLGSASVGLIILPTQAEAKALAHSLSPATLGKRLRLLCCPPQFSNATLGALMRNVRALYPAPEPSDFVWHNVCYASDKLTFRRRFICALVVVLYLTLVFSVLSLIRWSLGGIAMGLLIALSNLLLQEVVRNTVWVVERPIANTHFHASVAVITMFGCFVSGVCVPIFAILSADGFEKESTWFGENGVTDFVGNAIVTNATVAVLTDALVDTMLPWFFSHVLRRPRPEFGLLGCISRYLPAVNSFAELCEVHEGPVFYLGPNIGYACFTMLLALCAAPVLPAAALATAVGVTMWYYKEKWLLLELCRRPRFVSPHVALRGPDILSYGIAFVPLPAVMGLLPLCPPVYCTQTWWWTSICTSQMDMKATIIQMGMEAAIFANAAVHGWYLVQQVALRLWCCGCCRRTGQKRSCHTCYQGFLTYFQRTLRVIVWIIVSTFLWLTAYWRGGVGKMETIDLPFGSITIFTTGVRNTLTVIYFIILIVMVCVGTIGICCRVLGGSCVTSSTSGSSRTHGSCAEYVRSSPFHGAISEDSPTTLDGLRRWLQSSSYDAPVPERLP